MYHECERKENEKHQNFSFLLPVFVFTNQLAHVSASWCEHLQFVMDQYATLKENMFTDAENSITTYLADARLAGISLSAI